jgi:hypothetical protein
LTISIHLAGAQVCTPVANRETARHGYILVSQVTIHSVFGVHVRIRRGEGRAAEANQFWRQGRSTGAPATRLFLTIHEKAKDCYLASFGLGEIS